MLGPAQALYQGFGITVARDVPAFASYFLTYDVFKHLSIRFLLWASAKVQTTKHRFFPGGGGGRTGLELTPLPQTFGGSALPAAL